MEEGAVTDDKRIKAALPTIKYVLEQGASLLLMSHLGRPKGRLRPRVQPEAAAEALAKLLGKPVQMAPDCVGPEVEAHGQGAQARRGADAGKHPLPQGRGKERSGPGQAAGGAGRSVRQRCLWLGAPRACLHRRRGALPARGLRLPDGTGAGVPGPRHRQPRAAVHRHSGRRQDQRQDRW